jgi:hypothetical protein
MPLSLRWPKTPKTAADNADNTAISGVARSDWLAVGRL